MYGILALYMAITDNLSLRRVGSVQSRHGSLDTEAVGRPCLLWESVGTPAKCRCPRQRISILVLYMRHGLFVTGEIGMEQWTRI